METKATKEQLGELRTFSQETGRSFKPNVSFEEAERVLARRRRLERDHRSQTPLITTTVSGLRGGRAGRGEGGALGGLAPSEEMEGPSVGTGREGW